MSLFGFKCRFIKHWLCLKQDSPLFLVFLSLLSPKNISHSCFISGLWFWRSVSFLSTFPALLANCLLGVMSQSNQQKTQTNCKKKKKHVLVNGVHWCTLVYNVCVTVLGSEVLWHLLKATEQWEVLQFLLRSDCDLSRNKQEQFCDFSNHSFSALHHLLSYWHAILVDDFRLLGISEIHQEDCCYGDNGAKGRVK